MYGSVQSGVARYKAGNGTTARNVRHRTDGAPPPPYRRGMLHEFLTIRRVELIDRCRNKVALRGGAAAAGPDFEHGVPVFLDQLISTLRAAHAGGQAKHGGGASAMSAPEFHSPFIGPSAALHGRELLERGFAVDEVVRSYGDLCQAITELAAETKAPVDVEEFRTLNGCLDDAIATAVIEFSQRQRTAVWEKSVEASNERAGFLAHELRNYLHTAMLSVSAMKAGTVGINGATGAVLDRSLAGLARLVDQSLAEVRAVAQPPAAKHVLVVADFMAELAVSFSLEARSRGCTLAISQIDKALRILVDRDLLYSALSNLLQNAFKFTHAGSEVRLDVSATSERLRITVADHCGGLPAGAAETMFLPFVQVGADVSGLGLGLSIARRGVEGNGGLLSVRNKPGLGCIFTIDLPRHLGLHTTQQADAAQSQLLAARESVNLSSPI